MSYCINPSCSGTRINPDSAQFCQFCGTVLTIEGNRGHRYQLIKPLSEGHPYTEIFQVLDFKDQQTKVLKTLKHSNSHPSLIKLFQQEADFLIRLRHPAIPHYEDYFEMVAPASSNQQLRCLVMEYFEGKDLQHWIQDNGKLSEARAIDWLKQIVQILKYVHENGYFHRDIKPPNLLRKETATGKDELALIDFGIAKRTVNAMVNGQRTTIAYTPGYGAPEQERGQSCPQSDFYGLARTFVYLLTGLEPGDPNFEANWKGKTNCPNSPLLPLLDRMMEYDPQQRPQTPEEILQAIERIDRLRQTKPPRSSRFKPWMLLPIGAIGLAGLAISQQCPFNSAACSTATKPDVSGNVTPPQELISSDRLISAGTQSIEDINPALELTDSYLPSMLAGMTAYFKPDYGEAEKQFKAIRDSAAKNRMSSNKAEKDDALAALRNPLPLIYAGNATAHRRSQQTGQPIYSIGVAVPLNSDPGVDTLRGIALMQQKAIEQGINVEFLLANDRNIPAQSKQIARALVNRKVLAVIGHYTSSNTCAGLSVYDPAKLVLISPVSTVLNLQSNCSKTQNRVFFRTTSSTAIEAGTLIQYLKEQPEFSRELNSADLKVAVFFNPNESDDRKTAFSPDLTEQFTTQLKAQGGEVLEGEPIDLSSPTFNASDALQRVQDADVLALFPDGQFTQQAFQNAVELIRANQGKKKILGANTLYLQSEVFEKVEAKALENTLIMAVEWQEQCGARSFLNRVSETYASGSINRRTALAYEAAQALIARLKPGIDSIQIRDALATGASIPSDVIDNKRISFNARGDRKEYTSRILVTLAQQNNQLKVVPINEQCQL